MYKTEDLEIVDVHHIATHGGGIRVIAQRKNEAHFISKRVTEFVEKEIATGLQKITSFLTFGNRCQMHKKSLNSLLNKLKGEGKRIAGYGAAGRGTILLNYCHITKGILDYIVDISPLRNNLLMPGVHIPIYPLEKAHTTPPDYFLILAWNYADSIMKQEQNLTEKGVQWIVPFPEITIH
jgi:hypothetical protein